MKQRQMLPKSKFRTFGHTTKDEIEGYRKVSAHLTGGGPFITLSATSFSRYKIIFLAGKNTKKYAFATNEALKELGINSKPVVREIHKITQEYKTAQALYDVFISGFEKFKREYLFMKPRAVKERFNSLTDDQKQARLEFDFLKYDTEKVNEGIIHIPDGGIEAYCKDNNIPITRFNVDDQLFDHLHNSFMPAGEIIADKKGNSGRRKFIAAFEKALKEYEKRHPEIS